MSMAQMARSALAGLLYLQVQRQVQTTAEAAAATAPYTAAAAATPAAAAAAAAAVAPAPAPAGTAAVAGTAAIVEEVAGTKSGMCSPAEVCRAWGRGGAVRGLQVAQRGPFRERLPPRRDCQQGTRGPQADLNNDEFRTSPVDILCGSQAHRGR